MLKDTIDLNKVNEENLRRALNMINRWLLKNVGADN